MHDDIAKVHDLPAVAGQAFFFTFFLVFLADVFQHSISESVEHAVAGACTEHEVVGKLNNLLKVKEHDVFALFIFQGIDDLTGKFKCVQCSPLNNYIATSGAENRRVYTEPVG